MGRQGSEEEKSVDRSEFGVIIYETDGPVARIVFNEPERANIQTARQVEEMEAALDLAEADDNIKVVVLKGNGNGFCAGHAIVGIDEMPEVYPTTGPTFERTWRRHHYGLFLWPPLRLWEFPKETIAQVHGYCVGGGTVYGLLTDLTVASDDAYFQMPLPQGFGLPGAQTMLEPWVLMNFKRTAEYLFLAPTIKAEQALEWGMVNRVVPRDQLEQTVEDMARTIAQMPLTTIMATKSGIKRAWELMGLRSHFQQSADLVAMCTQAREVQEFMAQTQKAGRRPRQTAAARSEARNPIAEDDPQG